MTVGAEWEKALVGPDDKIRDMIAAVGKSRQRIALVVDAERRLLGTVTDGDIRRSILDRIDADQPVRQIMYVNPITVSVDTPREERIRLMRGRNIEHLPIVDDAGRVIGLTRLGDLIASVPARKSNPVVVLAGGLGHRLRPLTDTTPKPLLGVGGRPILETIVRHLADHGYYRIYLSVNHLAESIRAHFGDGRAFGVEISYLEEPMRLGTAGPLGLIEKLPAEPMIVMNGDLLTNADLSAMLAFHEQNAAAITVATRDYEMQIPYGVLKFDNLEIVTVTEKPIHRFPISAGIYVVSSDVIALLPKNAYVDMPDFLKAAIDAGRRVVGFPIHEFWLDIGRIEDFTRAHGEYSDVFD